MKEADDTRQVPVAWGAAAFSAVCPGLGHLYCGKTVMGLTLLLLSLLVPPMTMATAFFEPSGAVLVAVV